MSSLIKKIERQDDTTLVRVGGQITFEHSPEFHQSLIEVSDEKPNHLIINLSDVSYIDSSGVGTLTDILRRMHRTHGRLSLVGMNAMVRGVFEITRLDRVFSIHDSEEQALKV